MNENDDGNKVIAVDRISIVCMFVCLHVCDVLTLPVRSARVVAMALVPLAKASISNTPIGPFQITV